MPIAQFYIPKTDPKKLITDADFREYWTGHRHPQGQATAAAWATAHEKRFFHWFLEFPEIFHDWKPDLPAEANTAKAEGPAMAGFDLILGNPPYLGGQALSGTYGHPFCEYVKWEYAPTGLSDLVAFFVRRVYSLLRPGGFTAFITTNSIKDGDIRKDGLEQVVAQGGSINMAVRGIKWPGQANLVVSLVALHKGDWKGVRLVDGIHVSFISSFFEDTPEMGNPLLLQENLNQVFQGTIPLGDGFMISKAEASSMLSSDKANRDVIMPVTNGEEVNSFPDQSPGRAIINFGNRTEDEASCFPIPFSIIKERVKPARMKQKNPTAKRLWWRYYRYNNECYAALKRYRSCFVAAATTKYLNYSRVPTNAIFLNTLYVFTTDRWDLFAVVQSTIHEVWARKYSGALKQDLRYSPSKCFDTFPFPADQWEEPMDVLATLGERYHEHRRTLMRDLWLGLTPIYNLFHDPELSPEKVAKVSKKPLEEARAGYDALLELRRLHLQLDQAVRDAYGWADLDLGHDFVDVETLPENDRTRYTITPTARKELLTRLLVENHKRAAEQVAAKPAKGDRAGANKREEDSTRAGQIEMTYGQT